jgi:hypothetical protein
MGYTIKDLRDSDNDASILKDLIFMDEFLTEKEEIEKIKMMRRMINNGP